MRNSKKWVSSSSRRPRQSRRLWPVASATRCPRRKPRKNPLRPRRQRPRSHPQSLRTSRRPLRPRRPEQCRPRQLPSRQTSRLTGLQRSQRTSPSKRQQPLPRRLPLRLRCRRRRPPRPVPRLPVLRPQVLDLLVPDRATIHLVAAECARPRPRVRATTRSAPVARPACVAPHVRRCPAFPAHPGPIPAVCRPVRNAPWDAQAVPAVPAAVARAQVALQVVQVPAAGPQVPVGVQALVADPVPVPVVVSVAHPVAEVPVLVVQVVLAADSPVVRVDRAVARVGPVARSATATAPRVADASPSAPSVKSSTTCRPRPSVASRSLAETAA